MGLTALKRIFLMHLNVSGLPFIMPNFVPYFSLALLVCRYRLRKIPLLAFAKAIVKEICSAKGAISSTNLGKQRWPVLSINHFSKKAFCEILALTCRTTTAFGYFVSSLVVYFIAASLLCR